MKLPKLNLKRIFKKKLQYAPVEPELTLDSVAAEVASAPMATASDDAPVWLSSPPFLLMVGSLTGVALKDAKLFAEGLAERFITAPALAKINVQLDKPRNRILYEIHEGGPGYSILPKVLELLNTQRTVRVELANEAHVEISDEFGELVTLHHPAGTHENLGDNVREGDDTPFLPIQSLVSTKKLNALYPVRKGYVLAGALLMITSAAILLASGVFFAVKKSGAFDSDPVTVAAKGAFPPVIEDNPYWHLQRAKKEAGTKDEIIGKLEKSNGKWVWSFKHKAAEPKKEPPALASGDLRPVTAPSTPSSIAAPTAPASNGISKELPT